MKRFWNVKARLFMVLAVLATFLSGCELLSQLAGGLLVNGLSLLGVQPAADFNQSGKIKASMVPTNSSNTVILSSLQSMGLRAQVKGEDGRNKECQFVDESEEIPSVYNSVAMLIDDSGSMGLSYPADVCATCPHDPKNLRGDAAQELATVVFKSAPESQLAIFDFGPATDPDLADTRTLADFTNNATDVSKAIDKVDGSIDAGTPLWDSIAETLNKIEANANSQDQVVDKTGGEGSISGEGTVKPAENKVKRYLIVLTDGEDTLSDTETLDSVIALAQSKNVPIYAVGLGPASAASSEAGGQSARVQAITDLQRLAEGTGGFYAAARNAEELRTLYATIGKAMSEGYKGVVFDCDEDNSTTSGDTSGLDTSGSTSGDTSGSTSGLDTSGATSGLDTSGSTSGTDQGSSRKVEGNLLLGNFVSIPFNFVRPD